MLAGQIAPAIFCLCMMKKALLPLSTAYLYRLDAKTHSHHEEQVISHNYAQASYHTQNVAHTQK